MKKRALITGITGQDGSYLAEFLLEKDYEVYGLFRRGSTNTTQRIASMLMEKEKENKKLHLVYGATARPSDKDYETINDSPDAITFSLGQCASSF